MNQSSPLYDSAPALSLIEPWLATHLPALEPAARRHFTQLVSSIFESRSLLIETIAASSPFCATPTSNATQVRRILRDHRLTLEQVYYPFIRSILATVPGNELYLTIDATSHGTEATNYVIGCLCLSGEGNVYIHQNEENPFYPHRHIDNLYYYGMHISFLLS